MTIDFCMMQTAQIACGSHKQFINTMQISLLLHNRIFCYLTKFYFSNIHLQVLGSCVFIGPYFREIKKRIQDRVHELTSKTMKLQVLS